MTDITNDSAGPDSGKYNICQRSGRKAKPGELVKEAFTQAWVLPEFADPYPQNLRIEAIAENLEGALRPEGDDIFISGDIDPADL